VLGRGEGLGEVKVLGRHGGTRHGVDQVVRHVLLRIVPEPQVFEVSHRAQVTVQRAACLGQSGVWASGFTLWGLWFTVWGLAEVRALGFVV